MKTKLLYSKMKHMLILAFSVLAFGSCQRNTKINTNLNQAKVRVITVGEENIKPTIDYVGTVESSSSVNVSFPMGGTVERMLVSEGELVRKGQLLATVNSTTLQNSYNASLATLQQAEDAYKRMKEMYENKSIPEIKYIDVKTKWEQAKASETSMRKLLADASLYAPENGVISRKFVEQGTNVAPSAPIYAIANTQKINVMVPIPEKEINNFKIGQECTVQSSAVDGLKFRGKIIEKGVVANPISHTYPLKISILGNNEKLMPGMVVRVWIDNNADDNQKISVPIKNVLLDYPDKRFVWVIDENNKAQRREVTLGTLIGNQVVITKGLSVGDKVVTDGYQYIGPDTVVDILP